MAGLPCSRNLSRLSGSCDQKPAIGSHRIRRDGAFSIIPLSAERRVLFQQAQAISFAGRVSQPDIERADQSSPNLLMGNGQNRAHPRPRQWLWLAADGCASCPLLQRCSPKFLPLGFAHSSRNQETPVCTVLHCVTALAHPKKYYFLGTPSWVQQRKPLPVTSHRGRE
jgi:hypothetical protein